MIKKTLIYFLLTIGALAADVNYTILNIAESSDVKRILVDGDWRKDCPKRIEVKIRASEDISSKGLVVKAYFFDKDKRFFPFCCG